MRYPEAPEDLLHVIVTEFSVIDEALTDLGAAGAVFPFTVDEYEE